MKEISKNISPIDEMSDIWKPLTYEERIYLRENTKYLEFKKNEYIYLRDNNELEEYKKKHANEKYLINRNKG